MDLEIRKTKKTEQGFGPKTYVGTQFSYVFVANF